MKYLFKAIPDERFLPNHRISFPMEDLIDEDEAKRRLDEVAYSMTYTIIDYKSSLDILTAPPPKPTNEMTEERIDNALKLISELKKTLICIANNNLDS